MTILVTGSAGMIGRHLVKELLDSGHKVVGIDRVDVHFDGDYEHFSIDIGDKKALEEVFSTRTIDRVIHLAALAHTTGGKEYPKSMYEYLNVECANNVFQTAKEKDIPVLFISTVDVFGFQKGKVNPNTECHPVTIYGKTKYAAEQSLKRSGCRYSVFRFSPIYTPTIKRDIQKRYYLRYPDWAYLIGKGTDYEVLNIDLATDSMIRWCEGVPNNEIRIIKDPHLLNTKQEILKEKEIGNAKHIIHFPRWIVNIGYGVLRLSGKNKVTFLINKALYPLRSESNGN